MIIKILKECTAPVSSMWYCGDVCRCSHIEWNDEPLIVGEEYEAETSENWGNTDTVRIDNLKFNVDYSIVSYP